LVFVINIQNHTLVFIYHDILPRNELMQSVLLYQNKCGFVYLSHIPTISSLGLKIHYSLSFMEYNTLLMY